MSSRPAIVSIAVLAISAMTGCGDGDPPGRDQPPQTPAPISTATGESSTQNNLFLNVSNQSSRHDPVHITVTLDGVTIVDRAFAFGGGHSWVSFPLTLRPGSHRIHAVSDTGGDLVGTVTIPVNGVRHALLDYWDSADEAPRQFTFDVQVEPFAFA